MPEERDDVELDAFERVDPSSQRIDVRSSLGYTVRQGGSRGVGGGLIYEESNRLMTIYSEPGMDRWFYEINGAQWLPADVAATGDETRRVATRVARALDFLQLSRFELLTPRGSFIGGDGQGVRFEARNPEPTWTAAGVHTLESLDGVRITRTGPRQLLYADAGRTMSIAIAAGRPSSQLQVSLDSLERWRPPHHASPVTHAERDRAMERLGQALKQWGVDQLIFVREFDQE